MPNVDPVTGPFLNVPPARQPRKPQPGFHLQLYRGAFRQELQTKRDPSGSNNENTIPDPMGSHKLRLSHMSKNNTLIGIGLMILASAVLSSKDGIVKGIVHDIGPFQILWIQFVGTFLIMALISAPMHGINVIRTHQPGLQFIRGALNVGAVSCFFFALKYIPMADATAMMLFAPVVATILSPFFLGEKIGVMRITAAAFGFCGVLTILRPGFAGESTGYYFAFAAGVLLGLYFISNRKLAGSQHWLLNITHNAMMGAIALSPSLYFYWEPVDTSLYVEMAFIIGMGVIGQSFMISSFKFGPAAVISPFSYTMLLFATLIGYFIFGDAPDLVSWVGMALIVGSGLYIAHREHRAKGGA